MEASDQSVTDYFLYVKNVLGVKTLQSSSLSVAVTESAENPMPAAEEAPALDVCDLLFLHIRTSGDTSVFSPDVKSLAEKMIQAMRLGKRKFLIHEIENSEGLTATDSVRKISERVQAPFVVLFSAKPGVQGIVKNLGPQKYIETLSPSYLLNHPQAKKVAWLDLQKVMKELGIA